jgi:O-antigen/teichoic acid export membrane protein
MVLTTGAFALSQLIRLISNMVLARLLFPEAFGLMALVQVITTGAAMVSDLGIGPSIQGNERGDDQDFLDTAWTISVVRGLVLFVITLALAWPGASFYSAPELTYLIPLAGLAFIFNGFHPTRIETANRHLLLGKVTLIELSSQVLGIIIMLSFAWNYRAAWTLTLPSIVGPIITLVLADRLLPGQRNRFRFERTAASELVRFGKWLFLSTLLAFVISQGDKAILGKFIPLDSLGSYRIGLFLASFPTLLGGAVIGRVFLPLYREVLASNEELARQRLQRLRGGLTAAMMSMLLILGFLGGAIVELLYDERYALAGSVLTAVSITHLLHVVGLTYDQAALAQGDSRTFFWVFLGRAIVQTGSLLVGLAFGGLAGAIIGQGIGYVVVHGMNIALARRHSVWDPVHDCVAFLVAVVGGSAAAWASADILLRLPTS